MTSATTTNRSDAPSLPRRRAGRPPSATNELSWIAVLDQEDCWNRISNEPLGRIAFITHGHPQVLPINYAADGQTVVFRTSSLFEWLSAPLPVALEIDQYDSESATGWSVIVHGQLTRIEGADETGACERLGLMAWAPGERNVWFRLTPTRVSGRLIGRRRRASDGS